VQLIGSLYDLCNTLLLQMVEFHGSGSGEDELRKYYDLIPNISELVDPTTYGMDPDIAFALGRPLLAAANDDLFGSNSEDNNKEDDNNNDMADDDDDNNNTTNNNEDLDLDSWNFESEEMENLSNAFLPADTDAEKVLSKLLYRTFWSLRTYDVYLPDARYENEVARLTAKAEDLNNKKDKKATSIETRSKELEKKSVAVVIKKLEGEQETQRKHVEYVMNHLDSIKADFLKNMNAELVAQQFSHTFLSLCVYPRCMFSPEDAMFCAKFAMLLHDQETPHFPTLNYLDKLMKSIPNALFCITENEAKNLALFLKETWKTLNTWRYDEEEYTKSAGSRRSFKAGGKR